MKKQQPLFVVVVLALAVIATIVWKSPGPNSSVSDLSSEPANAPGKNASKVVRESAKGTQPTRNDGTSNLGDDIAPKLPEQPLYQMAETRSSFDPVADAKRRDNAPFRIQGRGSKAKIVGSDGKVLIEPDEKVGIYGCSVSPNGRRIAVYYGDAKYDIVTPSTGETIRLPQQPPGENVLGFGSWHWIDDQTLIGVSGKTIPFRKDQVGTEREEPIISRSVLYLYDLKEQKMSEVALPSALRTKTVCVSAVDETGKVQLQPDGRGVSFTDVSLGWFEVRPKK